MEQGARQMAKPGTSVEREAEMEKVTETMTERRPQGQTRPPVGGWGGGRDCGGPCAKRRGRRDGRWRDKGLEDRHSGSS